MNDSLSGARCWLRKYQGGEINCSFGGSDYGKNRDAGVTFIAWDQSSGANGDLVDATVRGGVSAFSVKKDVATVAVS